jgi:hypothetical protein
MTQFPVPTTWSVLVGGLPRFLEFEQGTELTTALILPGDLVEFTAPAADCSVKAGQADSTTILGVANIHPVGTATPPRGGSRLVAYAAGDTVEVINGPITVMLRIASSEDIQCGELVQPAASGEVAAFVCGTDNACQLIAQALETTAADTTTFQWAMFQLRMG